MSAASLFPLMTVEQFEALPKPKGDFTYELHFGRLVKVGKVKMDRFWLQCRLRDLLKQVLDAKTWVAEIEIPYNLFEGFDDRAADVGVVARDLLERAVAKAGTLKRSPGLVIFIKWRSNRDTQIEQDALECLTHGAEAAWYIKTKPKFVIFVYTLAGRTAYHLGQEIPLPASMGGHIRADDLLENMPR
jgi:hypothetical protein